MSKEDKKEPYTPDKPGVSPNYSNAVTSKVQRPAAPVKSLYWYGMLPETKPFSVLRFGDSWNPKYNDYVFEDSGTTKDFYVRTNKYGDQSFEWIGKCRGYQGLSVTGCTFVATTDKMERSGDEMVRLSHPGKISAFTTTQIEAIKRACLRNVLRVDNANKRKPTWSLINLDQGNVLGPVPPGANPELNTIVTPSESERQGDVPVAAYVYMVRLDADPSMPEDQYWHIWPSMHQFFGNPPPALLEFVETSAVA